MRKIVVFFKEVGESYALVFSEMWQDFKNILARMRKA